MNPATILALIIDLYSQMTAQERLIEDLKKQNQELQEKLSETESFSDTSKSSSST